ncbi:MAG: CRISPR-associated ring nuclease Crn3/Csx3 [Candidatus Aenigmatarchaeota archaeon]
MKVVFNIEERNDFVIISFDIINNILSPNDLKEIKPPEIFKKGVVLSGRGPIWLYGYLIHFYHPAKFVATYDPRLGGAIIVESHCNEYKIGDLIKI